MNKNTYIGLIFAASLGFVAMPLYAEESSPAIEQVESSAQPEMSAAEHKAAVEFHKGQVELHKKMAIHHRSKAAVLGNTGKSVQKREHMGLAAKEDALVIKHEKAAAEHEKM